MVNFSSRLGSLGLAFFFVLAMPARAEVGELPLCPLPDLDANVLNPNGDPTKRMAALESLIAVSGKRGNYSGYRYKLGSLYRLGRKHPAGIVDRDIEKAELLLSHAALEGEVMAMAGMAEIKLSQKDPMSAMVWAQAHAHYLRALEPKMAEYSGPYIADLLSRIYEKLGRSEAVEQEIVQYVSAFVATHGPKIEKNHGWQRPGIEGPMCRHANLDWPLKQIADEGREILLEDRSVRKMRSPGVVLFELWINPEGRVVHALVVDSLPDQVTAEGLAGWVKRSRFNQVAPDAPLRVMKMRVPYDDDSTDLRN